MIFDQDGEWTVHYAIALARPLPTLELDLKISDLSRTKQSVRMRHKTAVARTNKIELTADEVDGTDSADHEMVATKRR